MNMSKDQKKQLGVMKDRILSEYQVLLLSAPVLLVWSPLQDALGLFKEYLADKAEWDAKCRDLRQEILDAAEGLAPGKVGALQEVLDAYEGVLSNRVPPGDLSDPAYRKSYLAWNARCDAARKAVLDAVEQLGV